MTEQSQYTGGPAGPYTSSADKRRQNYQFGVIIGALVILIVLIVVALNPFEGGGSDSGVPFDDEVITTPVEPKTFTDAEIMERANQAYEDDPAGICFDVTVMDEQAAVALIQGSTDADERQAQLIYDTWIMRCRGG